jgi:hypothetical protein
MPEKDGAQTHADIPEIPDGVVLPDSSGSLAPDVEDPEPEDYSDVGVPDSYPDDKAEGVSI